MCWPSNSVEPLTLEKSELGLEPPAIVGVKWGAAAKLSTQVVSWAVTLLVVRLLVPADYGLMALCAVVLSTISGLAGVGLRGPVVQARPLHHHHVRRGARGVR